MTGLRNIFCMVILMASTTICLAQKVNLSAPIKDDFSMGFTKVIGYTPNGYFVQTGNLGYDVTVEKTGFRSPKYKLGFFNKDLSLVWDKPVESEPSGGEVIDIKCVNGLALVFSSYWDDKTAASTIYVTTFDTSGNKKTHQEVCQSIKMSAAPYAYGSATSLRGGNIAIYALSKAQDEKIEIRLIVIDEELRLISQTTGQINQPVRNFSFAQIAVSESGHPILLGKRNDKSKGLSSKRNISWFSYFIKNKSLIEIPVGRGLETSMLGIAVDEFRNQAVITGFVEEKDSYVGAGILTYRLGLEDSADTNIVKQSTTIDAGQNIRLKGARNLGEGGGLAAYPIRKIIPKGNGGLVLIAESAFTTEYSYFDSFSQSYTRRLEFNFGDIVVFSLDKHGAIDWSTSVQKDQISMDDGGVFSSYCMMTASQKLATFFSEPINRKSRVLMCCISHLGVTDKTVPIPVPEGTLLLPEGARQIDEQDLLVPAVVKRKLHLIQISVN